MNKKYIEYIEELKHKKIAIIGIGVSNLPLIKILKNNNCDITVFDKKEEKELEENTYNYLTSNNIKLVLGNNYQESLHGFDIIFRSPSFLPTNLEEQIKEGSIVTTEIEQVLKLSPCKIIGVTGSKGKTTTTTIIYNFLKSMNYNVYLGGNIGTPLFDKLGEMTKDDIVVLELSSFQLMNMPVSPDIAVITNISPDHLDVHKSYKEYITAKKYIFTNQNTNGIVVLNLDDEIVSTFGEDAKGEIRYFKDKSLDKSILKDCYVLINNEIRYNDTKVIDTTKLKLKGVHNYLNMCAALNAIRDYINVSNEELEEIASNIMGVNHRLEFVRNINGVEWYNDSAGTSPNKSLASIRAFPSNIILIAGGSDKKVSYEPLKEDIIKRVKVLILFGQTKDKIYEVIKDSNVKVIFGDTLESVINLASENSDSGDIVLFSPASASFDMFKNAYQRGDLFKKLVQEIDA